MKRQRRALLRFAGASLIGLGGALGAVQRLLAAGLEPVAPGVHRVKGAARINGRPAEPGMPVGPGDTVEYQLGMLLQAENYYRFQTGITHPDSEALDNADPANIKRLQALSREMIVAQTKRIDEACSRLLRNKP